MPRRSITLQWELSHITYYTVVRARKNLHVFPIFFLSIQLLTQRT